MTVSELRIGNIVCKTPTNRTMHGSSVLVSYISDSNEVQVIEETNIRRLVCIIDIEPIPITAEWLEVFGFVNRLKTNIYVKETKRTGGQLLRSMAVFMDESNCTIALLDYYTGAEKSDLLDLDYFYVHQLQNLFFALTGEELKVKEQKNG